MACNSTIVRNRQLAIRRELDRRGASLKIIAADSGIPYATLASYFPASGDPAVMSAAALFGLCEAGRCGSMPADLLSWVLPDGFAIVRTPAGIDHDTLADLARDYLDSKMVAHRADSPGGVAIAPCEDAGLIEKATRLKVAA